VAKKRYSAEETQLIVGMAKESKSMDEIATACNEKFSTGRNARSIRGHVKKHAGKTAAPETVAEPVSD
jgi:hypothetical protein